MQDVSEAIAHHPEHTRLHADDPALCDKEGIALMLDIVAENGPSEGIRCAEIGAGTGGLTRLVTHPILLSFHTPCKPHHDHVRII